MFLWFLQLYGSLEILAGGEDYKNVEKLQTFLFTTNIKVKLDWSIEVLTQ